jgi:hypothetical protein
MKLHEKCRTLNIPSGHSSHCRPAPLAHSLTPAVKFTLEQREYRYSSTLSLTSALDGQRHAPAALTPGKTRYPLYRRLGGPHGRSGRVRKISLPPGFDPRTVQPVASHYTDCAIPAHPTPAVLRQNHTCPNIHHGGIQRMRKYSSTYYKPRHYIMVWLTPRPLYPRVRPRGGLYVLEGLCI